MKLFLVLLIVLCPVTTFAQAYPESAWGLDDGGPRTSEDAAVFFNPYGPPPQNSPTWEPPDTSGWGENNYYEQERRNREMEFDRKQEQSWGNFGVPGSERPIPCGPYYDPSMRPGC